MWVKLGLIFSEHHAQLPVADVHRSFIRVYYSTRVGNRSVPLFFDFEKCAPWRIINIQKDPILRGGIRGSFDWAGIMPTAIVNISEKVKYLYYIGWSLRKDVPYHNSLGLAISEDGGINWKKYSAGPIFGTSRLEPGFVGAVEILRSAKNWIMYYLSCRRWIEYKDCYEPVYDIKIALSQNGVDWKPMGKTAINLKDDEGGITSPRIRPQKNGFEMIFCVRKKIEFRDKSSNAYRIKKSFSSDLINWKRDDEILIDTSSDGFDSFMTCYPFYFKNNEKEFILYNGNGFGETGIGLALWT